MPIKNNIIKIYLLKFFAMFLVIMPVMVPFFLETLEGMTEVYILQVVFAVFVFVFEIPSGYISDIIGRKKTLVLGTILKGVGFTLFSFVDSFVGFIFAQIFLSLAVSLNSGTDVAILYDSLDEIEPGRDHSKYLGRSLSMFTIGEGTAALISSYLLFKNIDLKTLMYISSALGWIPFLISLTLIEPSRKKLKKQAHSENIKYIYNNVFRQSKLLNLIIANMSFSFCGTLIAVWCFQKYWSDLGIPMSQFGILWAISNFTVSLFGIFAYRFELRLGANLMIIFISLLPMLGFLGMYSVSNIYLGFLICLLFQACRGLSQVIYKNALNRRVGADYRASANSIVQMGARVNFIILSPIFGYLIDLYSLKNAVLFMSMIYLLVLIFITLPLLRERKIAAV